MKKVEIIKEMIYKLILKQDLNKILFDKNYNLIN